MAVELKKVTFGYRGQQKVLDDFDWNVASGEFHSVLGASGSGKTTLLRLIAGLEQPQSGSIWISSKDATHQPAHRRGLALVGQSAATYEHLSVLENLKFAEQLSGQVTPGLRQELLGQFGLGSTLEQKPSELSGGQLQRLAIVRALLTQRPLLLMDEPLAHLQESLRGPIRRLLRNWQQAHNLTCIYVTHDSLEACEISDRLSVIGQGKPLQTAAPGELYRYPNSREVAELMGRPSIQWIQVPESDKHVGLRPADWQLISVGSSSIGSEELVEIEPDRVRTIGRLVAIRQVESWTWLEVQVKEHRLVAVRQESPAPQSNEQGRSAWQELKIDDRVELINTQPIWIDAGS